MSFHSQSYIIFAVNNHCMHLFLCNCYMFFVASAFVMLLVEFMPHAVKIIGFPGQLFLFSI